MKSTFSSSAITMVFLVITSVSNAQIKLDTTKPVLAIFGTETDKKIVLKNGILASYKLANQKIKKATIRSYLQKKVYTPYPAYNPAKITLRYKSFLPYNNYKEKERNILTGAGYILLSILADKIDYKYYNPLYLQSKPKP